MPKGTISSVRGSVYMVDKDFTIGKRLFLDVDFILRNGTHSFVFLFKKEVTSAPTFMNIFLIKRQNF